MTIIRAVKDLEPELYECIASSFRQDYPREKLSIRLCVASDTEPALPVLERVIADFPGFDARILVESRDPLLSGAASLRLGPNPKIRNVSRAYREADEGDVIWMVDCNVWLSNRVAGRMVDMLMGFGPAGTRQTPYKLVHMVPLVVDISVNEAPAKRQVAGSSLLSRVWNQGGGRLDEMFTATTHAKFYTALNCIAAAPCLQGKSTMFRKSHLEIATNPERNPALRPGPRPRPGGLDYFSFFICEDHLIGDVLWRWKLPGYARHGLLMGDLAIQPMRGVSVPAFLSRRVRWLRARKWTVLLATWVEPAVESVLSGVYFSFALTAAPGYDKLLGIPRTWSAFGALWLLWFLGWGLIDWVVFHTLHALPSVRSDAGTPAFAKGSLGSRRSLVEWLVAWLAREFLALPIWMWAFYLPTIINWRGKKFKVAADNTVMELSTSETQSRAG